MKHIYFIYFRERKTGSEKMKNIKLTTFKILTFLSKSFKTINKLQ